MLYCYFLGEIVGAVFCGKAVLFTTGAKVELWHHFGDALVTLVSPAFPTLALDKSDVHEICI